MPSARTLTRSPASSSLFPLLALPLFAACEAEPLTIEAANAPLAQQAGPGVTFAEVVTNGSGCPAGTADTEVSSDGLVFNTTFSSYVGQVGSNEFQSLVDCAFAIKLHSPYGRSYSVQTFAYSGYATLESGVNARLTADYYFQGQPLAPSDRNRTELTGPYDKSFIFRDDIDVRDRVWSPCGLTRDLNINTRIQVVNKPDLSGAGRMSIGSADGSLRVVFQLAERPCQIEDGGTPDGGRADAGTPDGGRADAGTPDGGRADAATPSTDVPARDVAVQPTRVVLQPTVIRRDQPFVVSWSADGAAPGTSYVVQVRTPLEDGRALFWESAPTSASSLRYAGPPFAVPGFHQVVVIARNGAASAGSEPTFLSVRWDSVPSDPPPDAGAPPRPDAGTPPPDAGTTPPPDAGTPPPPRDAGMAVPDAGGPTTALPPRGLYAVRAYSFWSAGSSTMTTMKDLSLAEVLQTPSGSVLQMRLCAHRSSSSGTVIDLVKPQVYPVVRRALRATAEGWSTDAEPVAVGFDRAGIAQCSGREGDAITRRNAQVWLDASCRCPYESDEAPTADDCRVTDPDNDRQPGLAHRQNTRYGVTLHLASVNRTSFSRGRAEADGSQSASLRADESRFQLACSPSGCTNMVEQMRPCTADQNRAQLVPLPSTMSWDCATVLANEQQLFPSPLPAAPRSCKLDTLTDAY